MKIGIAQITCVERRLDLNIKKHLMILHDAAGIGCKYVLFPELSLTGYFPEQLKEYPRFLIANIVDDFRAIASRLKISFTIGCPLWEKEKQLIGAVTFKADGDVIYHHKRVLFEDEQIHVAPGTSSPQFEIDGLKFNLCICAELKDERLFANAKNAQADVYCVSALITRLGYLTETAILQKYAAQGVAVLLANHASTQGYLQPEGRSCAWDNKGRLLERAGVSESLLVIDITKDKSEIL